MGDKSCQDLSQVKRVRKKPAILEIRHLYYLVVGESNRLSVIQEEPTRRAETTILDNTRACFSLCSRLHPQSFIIPLARDRSAPSAVASRSWTPNSQTWPVSLPPVQGIGEGVTHRLKDWCRNSRGSEEPSVQGLSAHCKPSTESLVRVLS